MVEELEGGEFGGFAGEEHGFVFWISFDVWRRWNGFFFRGGSSWEMVEMGVLMWVFCGCGLCVMGSRIRIGWGIRPFLYL